MPEQEIPCTDCEAKTREIELDGVFKVVSCVPVEGKDGWCNITYELNIGEP